MTGTGPTTEADRGTQLRNEVVDRLVADGTIVSPRIAQVMRAVPREGFAPEADLDSIYGLYNGFVTKTDDDGRSLSSVSAPQAQAFMLEHAAIEPGMNILEIGSGGMNAAYLAELVGPEGRVTTVDIDPFVTDRAVRLLATAGYAHVRVLTVDAENGVDEFAPYDRIIVTVGAWDIPPAWIHQLVAGGRIVVPLQVMGLPRVVALARDGDRLVSDSSRLFGFVPMQGAGQHDPVEQVLSGGAATLIFDDVPPSAPLPEHVLDAEPVVIDSGVGMLSGEPWATLQMWLATSMSGFCRVDIRSDVATPLPGRSIGLAVVDGATFAYVATGERVGKQFPLVVHAYGPDAARLAEAVAAQVRVWDRNHRDGTGPTYLVYPAGTSDAALPAADRVVDKRHSRVLLSWPAPELAGAGTEAPHRADIE